MFFGKQEESNINSLSNRGLNGNNNKNSLCVATAAGDLEQGPRHICCGQQYRLHKVLACKWEPIWVEDVPVQAASKSIRFLQILELTHFVSPNYIVKACWSALFQPHAPIVLVWHGSLSKKPFYETCIGHIERSRNRRRDNILGVDLKYCTEGDFDRYGLQSTKLICAQRCRWSLTTLRIQENNIWHHGCCPKVLMTCCLA